MAIASPVRRSNQLILVSSRWTSQRKAFGGKPLNQLAVIRSKMAAMIARTESLQAWLENITYQMTHMSYKIQADKLAGYVEASQFGSSAY